MMIIREDVVVRVCEAETESVGERKDEVWEGYLSFVR